MLERISKRPSRCSKASSASSAANRSSLRNWTKAAEQCTPDPLANNDGSKLQVADQIAAPHPAGLAAKAIEPLATYLPSPDWGTRNYPTYDLKGPFHADANRDRESQTVLINPIFLLRRPKGDKQDVGGCAAITASEMARSSGPGLARNQEEDSEVVYFNPGKSAFRTAAARQPRIRFCRPAGTLGDPPLRRDRRLL